MKTIKIKMKFNQWTIITDSGSYEFKDEFEYYQRLGSLIDWNLRLGLTTTIIKEL